MKYLSHLSVIISILGETILKFPEGKEELNIIISEQEMKYSGKGLLIFLMPMILCTIWISNVMEYEMLIIFAL